MSHKTFFKIFLGTVIAIVDYIVANAFDSFMMLFNSKSAVRELSNSDSAYIMSHVLQIKPWMFYILLIAINILLFSLIIGPKKNKNKTDASEE